MKEFWFDMDGTIADLYGVEDWLPKLRAHDASPYEEARPLVNLSRLARYLNKVQSKGCTVNIISWCSKNSCPEYDEKIKAAKLNWLAKHLPSVRWNRIEIVEYGVQKSSIGSGILFDDEEKNRVDWGIGAFEPENMFEVLATF